MSICVLHTNKQNDFESIIHNFERQTYADKTLLIMDFVNSTTPSEVQAPRNSSIKYINPLIILNNEFETSSATMMNQSKIIKDLVAMIDVETKKKNDVEKSIKAQKSAVDEAGENTNLTKAKTTLNTIVAEMKKLQMKKDTEDKKLQELKSNNEIIIKKINQTRTGTKDLNAYKNIILSEAPASIYTFMEEGYQYLPTHLENVVKKLSTSKDSVVTYTNAFMYNNCKLSLRESNKKHLILPLSSFTKEFFAKNDITAPIESYTSMQSKGVCIIGQDIKVQETFKKVLLVYSHNKSKILKMFNLHQDH